MNDIVGFLMARFSEDEAVARAASVGSGSWQVDDWTGETVLWWPPETPEKVERIRPIVGDDLADRAAQWSGQTIESAGDRIAPHIARWDPARVVAECEAKRRIVEFMVNEVKDARRRPGWTIPDQEVDELGHRYRAGVENQKAQQLPDALDRTDRLLRLLALPYADHPDYREEWKP